MTDVTGIVVFDSRMHEVPELRSDELPDRHLVFEGNGLVLDLMLREESGMQSMLVGGQILPRNDALSIVAGIEVLMKQGVRRWSTTTNALGEFAFNTIPNGIVDLVITLKDYRFVVLGLSNEAPRSWKVVATSLSRK